MKMPEPTLGPGPYKMGFDIGPPNLGPILDNPRQARLIFGTRMDNPCQGPARPGPSTGLGVARSVNYDTTHFEASLVVPRPCHMSLQNPKRESHWLEVAC